MPPTNKEVQGPSLPSPSSLQSKWGILYGTKGLFRGVILPPIIKPVPEPFGRPILCLSNVCNRSSHHNQRPIPVSRLNGGRCRPKYVPHS